MIERALVPRPVTRYLLLGFGLLIAHVCWNFMPAKLLAYVSGVAGPYCLLILTAIWSMRDKADDAFSGEHLKSDEFVRARKVAGSMRRRTVTRAVVVALCALAASSAAVSMQAGKVIWQWMILLGGLGVAEATYSYLIANAWEEAFRKVKDDRALAIKLQLENEALVMRIKESSIATKEPLIGWSVGQSTTFLSEQKSH